MQARNDTIDPQRRAVLGMGLGALALGSIAVLNPSTAHAAKSPIYTGFLSSKAVSGYDPVAYFTESKPVKGKKQFSMEYEGATWLFSSQANLDSFKADPEKYAPQYGGYCAYAVGIGQIASGDPENWDIVDGKLYINYNDSTQKLWHEKQAEYIVQGDANWPKVLQ